MSWRYLGEFKEGKGPGLGTFRKQVGFVKI